jgi:hypothetical protein
MLKNKKAFDLALRTIVQLILALFFLGVMLSIIMKFKASIK